MIEQLEKQLDSFDADQRRFALDKLLERAAAGAITLPDPGEEINLHAHTFFSFNSYGYSPTHYAWLARRQGLAAAGIVDFDVLDGLEEFLAAAARLNLKAVVGLETRVFIPEFADREINSPGEPGIAYHMGVGFPTAELVGPERTFLTDLRLTAEKRNRELTDRVNKHLDPVILDYQRDVIPLTPAGNATERHICLAYARRARAQFSDDQQLASYWSEKLGVDAASLDLPRGRDLLNTIRAKTMKKGGVGYVKPDAGSFPRLADTNRFLLAAGAVPTVTWLNGLSAGEQAMEELLDVAQNSGAAALNIIPDRNYTPGVRDEKVDNLYNVVELARQRHLPVIVGTEMNSPGQKFVDAFETGELKPLLPVFLEGAYIMVAHQALQRALNIGYTSSWARDSFPDLSARNDFFAAFGQAYQPQYNDRLRELSADPDPRHVLQSMPKEQ